MKKKIVDILGKHRNFMTPPIEKLLEVVPNKFLLVNVIAERAKQILKENRPTKLDEDPEKVDPIELVVAELLSGSIKVKWSPPPDEEEEECYWVPVEFMKKPRIF